jgi:hypothetical protein
MSQQTEYQQLEDYFADIRVDEETGCYLWEGSRSPNGYGVVNIGGRTQSAHRFSWEQVNGEIEDGLNILHECDVKLCLNPEHMRLGTKKDNTQDMMSKGRQRWDTPNRKRVTPEERAAMVSLHQQGQSFYRIAITLGRTSQQHVKQVIEKYLGIGTAAAVAA